MIRTYFLPGVAVVGVIFASWVMVIGGRQAPAALPVAQPSQPPFK